MSSVNGSVQKLIVFFKGFCDDRLARQEFGMVTEHFALATIFLDFILSKMYRVMIKVVTWF